MPVGSYEGRGVSSVLDLGKRKQKETTITYHLSSEGHSWESHAERSTKEEGIEIEEEIEIEDGMETKKRTEDRGGMAEEEEGL